jgi:DNA-binding beta-propeller fold protein YncE
MARKGTLVTVGVLGAAGAALFVGQARLEAALAGQAVQAPYFEVDPYWPKPLPNGWLLGMVIGVGVDSRDHVYIVHRGAATLNARTEAGYPLVGPCCSAAPPVLEFDPEGNLVRSWGGKQEGAPYTWPGSNHGIAIDHMDNVWIGGNGSPDSVAGTGWDSHVLKFTRDGKFVAQFGTPGQRADSKSMTHFGRVAKISFDTKANEAYLADGYGNRRVAVLDMTTGAIKRIWGAYGNVPSDSNYGAYDPDKPLIPQFRTPVHCADPSVDGLVYVCDRVNNRLQVFTTAGKFVKEVQVAPKTRGDGAVWDVAFSRDPQQKYLYMADGKNERVYVMDRQSLEILTAFGDGGRQPGQFFAVHSIATDSRGNIFTTETYEGKRLQRFVYKGLRAVSRKDQGAPWPGRM